MENQLFDFCVGVWVGGHSPATLSHTSKDAQFNFTSFDTNLMGAIGRRKKAMTEKQSKKWILRGLKLRGLRQNQISTLYNIGYILYIKMTSVKRYTI